MMLIKDAGSTANFSIILPGGCNAECDFCFWKRSDAESPMFLQQLRWHLETLGSRITQISITGGEPTASPLLEGVIDLLADIKPEKVVLTTNGYLLRAKLPMIAKAVHHINLSRHKVADSDNFDVFGNQTVPTGDAIKEICKDANKFGMDVTLNKVVHADYDCIGEFESTVKFCRKVGASALAIRKDYSDDTLGSTPLETSIGYVAVRRSCPVCVTNSITYDGLPVHFKMSLNEPSDVLDYVYEFVYHPNGLLTEDWAGKREIEYTLPTLRQLQSQSRRPSLILQERQRHMSSCGPGSLSSGC